jgi:hypothetical protein
VKWKGCPRLRDVQPCVPARLADQQRWRGPFFAFGTVDRWVTGLIWGWVRVPCSEILHTLDDVPRSRRECSEGPKRPDFCTFDLIHHTNPLIRRVENEQSKSLSGNALGFAVWEFLDLGHGVDDAGSALGLWHVSFAFSVRRFWREG